MKTKCNKSLLESQLRIIEQDCKAVTEAAVMLRSVFDKETGGVSVDWHCRNADSQELILAYICIYKTATFRIQEMMGKVSLELEPLITDGVLKHCT